MSDLETDSELQYRRLLKLVDEDLERREIAALKFLCRDVIPFAKLENIKRGLDLLLELERKHKLSPHENEFLAEILMHIGRLDLVKKLGFEPRAFKATINKLGPRINRFRLMLHHWADDLSSSEVQEMKFFISHHVPKKSDLENALTAQDVFALLEKNQAISPDDLSVLYDIADSLDRRDLRDKVTHFKVGGPAPVPQKSPIKTITSPLLGNATNPGLFERKIESNQALIGKRVESSPVVPTKIDIGDYAYNSRDPLPPPTLPPLKSPDELPEYKMDAKPRGISIIINNQNFYKVQNDPSSRQMPNRQGTNVDCGRLEYIFSKLEFQTITKCDLTSIQMVQLLQEVAIRHDHTQYDCFVCCILTHGVQGQLYGVDGRLVEIRDLTNYFKASTCTSLRGKPKLFFIQACQGKMKQIGVDLETDDPQEHQMGMEMPNLETLPNESDFLMGYATLPGFVSYRSKSQGSWYITTLVQMLDMYADRFDLLSIMIKVNEEVSLATAIMPDVPHYKQSPAPVPTLRKKIFFR